MHAAKIYIVYFFIFFIYKYASTTGVIYIVCVYQLKFIILKFKLNIQHFIYFFK